MQAASEIVQFGRLLLDPDHRRLVADGKPVPINARAYDMLVLLVARRTEVLSVEEIRRGVWGSIAVGDNNIRVQMSALRDVLADHCGEQVIVTVPGRGYRFVGEVSAPPPLLEPHAPAVALPAPPPPPPPPVFAPVARPAKNPGVFARPWVAALVAAALLAMALLAWTRPWEDLRGATAPRLSIAVMPFRSLSDDPKQGYFADAISEDLTTDLSHLPGSVVIARESADAFRNRDVSPGDIGRELKVRYLVQGSIRAEESAFRINAQLVDTATGRFLWTERFDTARDRLGDAQTEIVRRIASALDFELTQIESAHSLHDRPQTGDALDMFLRARSIIESDDSMDGLKAGQALLEQAVSLQADFADAQAELGRVLLRKVMLDDPDEVRDTDEANHAIQRALALAPRNARALAAEARARVVDGKCPEAVSNAAAALEIDANNIEAYAVQSFCAQLAGNIEAAVAPLLTVLRLDPEGRMNKSRYLLLGNLRLVQGRTKEAIDLLRKAVAGEPEPAPGADDLGRIEAARLLMIAATDLSGDREQAQDMYTAFAKVWPHRSVWRFASYYTILDTSLPGVRRLMDALVDAGMPRYDDEYADEHVPASSFSLRNGDFDATPIAVPGAQTIDTAAMSVLMGRAPRPLVIDVGRGTAVIPGAFWYDAARSGETIESFADRIAAREAHQDRAAVIVVTSDCAYGHGGYRAAAHLVSGGFRGIKWYRGGEEAWVQARLPAANLRLQQASLATDNKQN